MTIDLNKPQWNLSVTIGDVTVPVREPSCDELVAMTQIRFLPDNEIREAVRGAFANLTGLSADIVSVDQAVAFLQALADYIAARQQPAKRPAAGVMNSDRSWLFN